MNKQNQLLGAVLVLQIVILAVVYWPGTSVAEGELLFDGLEADRLLPESRFRRPVYLIGFPISVAFGYSSRRVRLPTAINERSQFPPGGADHQAEPITYPVWP